MSVDLPPSTPSSPSVEPTKIRVRRSSGLIEYVTPEEFEALNAQRKSKTQAIEMLLRQRRILIGVSSAVGAVAILSIGLNIMLLNKAGSASQAASQPVAPVVVTQTIPPSKTHNSGALAPVSAPESTAGDALVKSGAMAEGDSVAVKENAVVKESLVAVERQAGRNEVEEITTLTEIRDHEQTLESTVSEIAAPVDALPPPSAGVVESAVAAPSAAPQSAASSDSVESAADQPLPAQAEIATAEQEQAVRAAVEGWIGAWSAQQVDGYLAHYSPDFVPEGGVALSVWQAQRRTRLTAPAWIKVSVSDLKFTWSESAEQVEITLVQNFQSSSLNDVTTKELQLQREGGEWKIVRERSVK